jgi:hypothetical protein
MQTSQRLLLLAIFSLLRVDAWQKWDYKSTWSKEFEDWKDVWGYATGPRGRRGHSISMYGSKLIMFAGRDNEIQREHVPQTYVSTMLGPPGSGLVLPLSFPSPSPFSLFPLL